MNTLTYILFGWLLISLLIVIGPFLADRRALKRWRKSLAVGAGVTVCYKHDCFNATVTDFEYCEGFWEVTRSDGRSYVVADGNLYPMNYYVD